MEKKDSLKSKLGIHSIISPEMINRIRIWRNAYINKSEWLNSQVEGLELAATISGEIARLVTIENQINVEGSRKAEYINNVLSFFKDNKKNIVEQACAIGGMYFKPYVANEGEIIIDFVYQDEAVPFAFDGNGQITGVVFPSYVFKDKKRYTRLEIHSFSKNKYIIENKCFVSKEIGIPDVFNMDLGNEIKLKNVDDWKDIEPISIVEGAERPFYSYFRIPIANNIDRKSPLGISVYSRAIKDIRRADIQMSRLDWEFESKETAIELDENYLKKDVYGHTIMPKGKERLFREYSDDSMDKKLFEHYSPEIREQSFINGLNKYFQQIEFKCGLAYGTLSDPQNVDKTAEEIKTSKQRSYQLVSDIQASLEYALRNLIVSIDDLIIANNLCPDGDVDVSFKWDDSIIIDADKEKMQDIQDVNLGIMTKWEYRMKWYGESEEKARALVDETNSIAPGITSVFKDDD